MRKLIVAVVTLLALALAADRISVAVAERLLADRIQAAEGLRARPAVSISGFPFITQALTGDYERISVQMAHLQQGSVAVQALTASLRGVRVALSGLLSGTVQAVTADSARADIFITYAALDHILAPLGVSYGGSAQTVELRLGGLPGDAIALVRVTGRSLRTRIERLAMAGAVLPTVKLHFILRLPRLPFGVVLTGVESSASGLLVSAGGRHLVLTPSAG